LSSTPHYNRVGKAAARQKTVDCRHQTADSGEQASDSRQQTRELPNEVCKTTTRKHSRNLQMIALWKTKSEPSPVPLHATSNSARSAACTGG
jgi:hypothetical protein